MSGLIGLGPLEEKETTIGAMTSSGVSDTRIVAIGALNIEMFGLFYLKFNRTSFVMNLSA